MLSSKLNILTLAICIVAAQPALAESALTINGGEGAVNPLADMSVAGATQRTTTNNYSIRFRASCFGTNLRGVANPISPNGTITMAGKITVDSGAPQDFSISFPATAALVNNSSNATLSGYNLPPGSRAGFSGNMLVASITSNVTSSVDPVTAQITVAQQRFKISDISFTQAIPGDGCVTFEFFGQQFTSCRGAYSFYGYNGALSSSAINIIQSSDGKTFDVETSFPGEEGFCGGYHSPLMVFLDQTIPKFNNMVDFNMGNGLKTYWPEKNHPGYFLALPNKEGKVVSNKELFGESEEFKNGFLKLAVHDKNKDGVIDNKDPVFKKLVLWKDKSGKGVYSKKDAVPLASMVKSINLGYKPNVNAVTESVELREKSTIVMANPSKYPKAYIVDVWFKPSFGNENSAQLPKLSSK